MATATTAQYMSAKGDVDLLSRFIAKAELMGIDDAASKIQLNYRQLITEDAVFCMEKFLKDYPFIQFMYLVDTAGRLVARKVASPAEEDKFAPMSIGRDFSGREWFRLR